MIRTQGITQHFLTLFGALAAIGCLAALGPRAGHPGVGPEAPAVAPLLSPQSLKALAGGFAPALADIDWMRTASIASGELDPRGTRTLFDLLDRVTVLDPDFESAYHYGALLLSIGGRRADLSDRLLVRAEAQFPDNWSFPFYRAFNAFYHRTDFPAAADHLDRAVRLPGAPPFLADLARRFRDQAHNREVARELIERMIRVTADPVLRQRLTDRLRQFEAPA